MPVDPAYDPELFRATGHRLVDALADYLRAAGERTMPVLPSVPPATLLDAVPATFGVEPDADLVDLLLDVIDRSNHLHHPGYVGHQVATVLPDAALVEMAMALLNNGMAVYEMGQMHSIMERHVVAFLARTLGFGPEADGVLTHGGSVGNLTALLAARQAGAGYDVWSDGQREPTALLVSDQAHYCVARAVQSMGWGRAGAVAVPTDARFRLRPRALDDARRRAEADGRRVGMVVASCCSTATGSFDPLPEIADFCEAHDLWLHVDGAHGAALALSPRTRDRLRGIERADSVVWDLHKMLALPALNTAVLFRDGRRSYEAFAQEASYLFADENPRDDWFNIGQRTIECTKRALGVMAYAMLRVRGTDFFARHVERLVDVTAAFAEAVERAPDFEYAVQPEANILCFRHLGADDLDAHQVALRRRVIDGGKFYLVQARLRGSVWLRVTIMNPATTADDLAALLNALRAAAETRSP